MLWNNNFHFLRAAFQKSPHLKAQKLNKRYGQLLEVMRFSLPCPITFILGFETIAKLQSQISGTTGHSCPTELLFPNFAKSPKFYRATIFQKIQMNSSETSAWYFNNLNDKFFHLHCVKSVQIRAYFWSVFSCIRTEYRKILTRNNSVFGHFSRSVGQVMFRVRYTVSRTTR